jgi:hypothetical protein
MDEFEHAVLSAIVGQGALTAEARAQLPFISVVERTRDEEGYCLSFAVADGAPTIVPIDGGFTADLEIANFGTATASLEIRDGRFRSLFIEVPASKWPRHPQLVGLAAYPEP